MITPHDHQNRFLAEISAAHESQSRVLSVLPTGGGKTVCTAEDTRRRIERGQKVWILTHRQEIARQQQKTLRAFGIEPGMIMAGVRAQPEAPVQVAMVQTLVRRLREGLQLPDHIGVDEAHHDKAATWGTIHEFAPDATKTGWTATPVPGLHNCFDTIVEGPSATWLTKNGFLVPAEYWSPNLPDMTGIPITRSGDWSAEEMSRALARSQWLGDPIKSWRTHLWPVATAVAFCINKAHAKAEADRFNAAGIRAAVLTGDENEKTRAHLLRELEPGGDLNVLTTVDVVSEGFDLPSIDSVFLMRPTKKLHLVRQQIGRAIRTFEGKTKGVVLDHVGAFWQHGPITDEIEWDLKEGETKASRARRFDTEGQPLSMIRCQNCGHSYPAQLSACRKCGAEPERQEKRTPIWKAAELKRQTEDDAAKAKKARRAAYDRDKKACKCLADWQAMARKYDHEPGWAWRMHNFQKRGSKQAGRRRKSKPAIGADGWPV